MIRKLRRKFTLVCMLSLLVVLVVILGVVNALNYREIVSDADGVLAMLSAFAGEAPAPPEDFIDWQDAGGRYRSPELPYEIRFFSALLDGNGAVVSTNMERIFAVDEAAVDDYARQAYSSGASSGFVRDYRFARHEGEAGTVITFLDCGRMLTGFRSVLVSSVVISALGMAAVFALVWVFSGRVIRPIAESYQKQKRFITDAGHEIKTPLTVIDADLEILRMEQGENEWLQDIQAQTARLAALTNNLISLSKMEEEDNRAPMIEFPLSDAIRETAESFQALAKARGKALRVRVEPMLSFVGNEKNLCQLTGILLDNAIKYSPAGDSIELTLEKQGKAVRLSVENGVEHFSREVLDNMFDRFYRADRSRSSDSGGYGIGLSIAKAITAAHRGKIAASETGGRLTVAAVLPME